jgi:hypothetical protein
VPAVLKTPDFKIPSQTYSVENIAKWSAGGEDAWFYRGTDTDSVERKKL